MTLNKHSVLRFKPFNSKGSENINSKLTVLAIVSMMVLAGSAAILQMDDADAVVKDMTDKVIVLKSDDTVGHNVTLFTDEYKNSSYGYTMTWSITEIDHQKSQSDLDSIAEGWQELGSREYVSGGSNTYTPKPSQTIDGVVFTISERTNYSSDIENIGEYNLNIKAGENATDTKVALKCEVVVTISSLDVGFKVSNLYYLYSIDVESPRGDIGLDTPSVDVVIGRNVSFTISANTYNKDNGDAEDLNISGYNWYAIGLPAGLSMSDSGVVSGTPHKTAEAREYTVNVVGSSKDTSGDVAKTVECTLKFTLLSGSDGDITLSFTQTDLVKEISNVSYITEIGIGNVQLSVSQANNYPFDVLTVKVVDSTGVVKVIDDVNWKNTKFNIDISGTGLYRIYVTSVVDSVQSTSYVDLHVVGNLDSVFAEIIVSGA